MDTRKFNFLKSVLGEDGAVALKKAAERSAELENALVPRAILSWLGISARTDYEGELPGLDNTYLQFKKSEDLYSGSISIDDGIYNFDSATLYHLAASIAVSMGVDSDKVSSDVRDLDLARLGKSIDLLVKARVVTRELSKLKEEELDKTDAPGRPAKPREPIDAAPPDTSVVKTPPASPVLPGAKQPSIPKIPKPKTARPTMKITKSQAESKCRICAMGQLKDGKFKGCMCVRDFAKSVKLIKNDDGYTIEFKSGLGEEERLVLADIFNGK